ncbi:cytochrome P450 [Dactylonectria estremocensis]|uniref:Cytochrome P450 n=1 Tax=Dactylonectria estremocensis TaxID=1079267 RepID=A0A9P9J0A7_9HYPO|nr:cytochrome P450 [Dactylonectria estremocensis]
MTNHSYLALFGSIILVLLVLVKSRQKPQLPFPPQPPSRFIVGHLSDVIRENKAKRWHLHLAAWARQYGPIFGVRIGHIVDYYINTDQYVKEIFDKRSAQTANRPLWLMSSHILNNDFNTLFLDASDPTWKNQRKVINILLTNVQRAEKIVPLLEFETLKFLHESVTDPAGGLAGAHMFRAIGRYTYSVFSTVLMGMNVPNSDDPVIDFIKETEFQITNTFPGSNIIDLLPSLQKLPLFLKPWERRGHSRYQRDLEWALKRLEKVKQLMSEGDPSIGNSFLGSALQDASLMGFSCKEELAILAFALIGAAADTTRMTTWSFVEAMMIFPEVQKRAQAEVDKVVGDRIPMWDDFEKIPYIRMAMKEVWRWRPPVALGHPHVTARDMQVGEYFLPKGARIHINSYAIGHDPCRHDDPEQFRPERYANDHTTTMESMNAKDVTQRDHFAFGAGRRVCPGYHVAERSSAIAMMRMLWAFNITFIPDTKMPLNFTDYAGNIPGNPGDDMPARLVYRSEERKNLILDTYEKEDAARPHVEPLNMGEKSFKTPESYL